MESIIEKFSKNIKLDEIISKVDGSTNIKGLNFLKLNRWITIGIIKVKSANKIEGFLKNISFF